MLVIQPKPAKLSQLQKKILVELLSRSVKTLDLVSQDSSMVLLKPPSRRRHGKAVWQPLDRVYLYGFRNKTGFVELSWRDIGKTNSERAAASRALKRLIQRGLVQRSSSGDVCLTADGWTVAETLSGNG